MPLPLIIGIGALLGGAAAICNVAGREVNEELTWELDGINCKIEKLIKKTEEDYKIAADALNKSITSLNSDKETIQKLCIIPYCEVFKKVKNINCQKFNTYNTYISNEDSLLTVRSIAEEHDIMSDGVKVAKNVGDTLFSLASPIGGVFALGGKVLKGVKIMYQIDEAKEQLEEVKLECEKVQVQIDLMNDTAKKCGEISAVLIALSSLLNRATYSIEDIIRLLGKDYNCWDIESQKFLWSSINIAAGMNKIINTPIIKEDGNINTELVNIINEAKLLESGA